MLLLVVKYKTFNTYARKNVPNTKKIIKKKGIISTANINILFTRSKISYFGILYPFTEHIILVFPLKYYF